MKVLQTLLSMSLVASQAAVGAYKIRGAAEKYDHAIENVDAAAVMLTRAERCTT